MKITITIDHEGVGRTAEKIGAALSGLAEMVDTITLSEAETIGRILLETKPYRSVWLEVKP
jgi:hypothetical protein